MAATGDVRDILELEGADNQDFITKDALFNENKKVRMNLVDIPLLCKVCYTGCMVYIQTLKWFLLRSPFITQSCITGHKMSATICKSFVFKLSNYNSLIR